MLLPAGAAFLTAVIVIPPLVSWARRRNLLDVPNSRSSHTIPTPRVGGIGLVLGVAVGIVVASSLAYGLPLGFSILASGAAAIVAMCAIDDFRSLPALLRLAIQSIVAVAVAVMMLDGGAGALRVVALGMVTLWIVGLVNAYNFMDGIDGIAGGQALVAASAWAGAGLLMGAPSVTLIGLLVGAAALGFLVHNWHPARVFMGDTGSAFLGYTFAVLPLAAPVPAGAALLAGALFVWPFLLDTSLTLVARVRRGENVVTAHRSHLYQQLTTRGMRHSQVSAIYMALAAAGVPGGLMAVSGWFLAAVTYGVLLVAGAAMMYWKLSRPT